MRSSRREEQARGMTGRPPLCSGRPEWNRISQGLQGAVEADEGRGAVLWWAEEQSQQNAVACSERLLMSPSCRGGPHAARGGPGRGLRGVYSVGLFRRLHGWCWSADSELD